MKTYNESHLRSKDLIFNFIKEFSCFESALRMSSRISKDERAIIFWNDVKIELTNNEFSFTDDQREFEILKDPPKRLSYSKDKLHWKLGNFGMEPANVSNKDAKSAVDALVRVRNNLLHGGKEFGYSSESERNLTLITNAQVILDQVVKCLK